MSCPAPSPSKNMAQQDVGTVDGLLSYLQHTSFAADAATPLSGGYGNFVFRIKLKVPYNGHHTLIVKHAKPYLPGNEAFKLAVSRQVRLVSSSQSLMPTKPQDFEVGALRRVSEQLPTSASVTVPAVHLFDEATHVIIIDDAGESSTPLLKLMLDGTLSTSLAQEIGHALGEFLSRLHSWGLQDDDARSWVSANAFARQIAAWATYGRLVDTVEGKDPITELQNPPLDLDEATLNTIREIASIYSKTIATSQETFTMGDFWPGNLLVRTREGEDNGSPRLERIYVIDWEMSKAGLAGMDVGQFCGDVRVLLQFCPEARPAAKLLIEAFAHAYDAGCKGINWAGIATTHIGAHMVAWGPRIPHHASRRTRESTRALVKEGIKYLKEGHEDNWTAERIVGLFARLA